MHSKQKGNSRKKILWMENGEIFGGAEMFSLDILFHLSENYDTPLLIEYCYTSLHPSLKTELINIQKSLPSHLEITLQQENFPQLRKITLKNILKFFTAVLSLRKKIKQEQYNICYANTVRTGFLLSISGIFINTRKYFFTHDYTAPKKWIRYFHHTFTTIFSCSHPIKDFLHENGVPLQKIIPIENGIDPDKFSHISKGNIPPQKFGIIGRITEWKGQMTVLKTAKKVLQQYPNLQFYFFGEPSEKTEDQNFYKKSLEFVEKNNLKKNIYFKGFTPVTEALLEIDSVIHASEKSEPFGRTPLEGAISEKILLISKKGTPQTIFTHTKNALFFEPGESNDLFQQIVWTQKNPKNLEKIIKNAKQKIQKEFNLKTLSQKFWKNF